MARTIKEISEEIKQAFTSNPVLQDIYGITGSASFENEFSLASIETQLIEVFANESKMIEDLFDLHLKEVDDRISKLTPGTLLWYQHVARSFQKNNNLVWNTDKLQWEYPVINEDEKIIELASVSENAEFLTIKVAKANNNGEPEKLDSTELEAFKEYMNLMKYAGVILNFISDDPDVLRLHLKVYYNPLILASDGSLLTDSAIFPVNDAIDEYLKLIDFNGLFNITDLVDSLQKVEGVVNPIFQSASARFGIQPFAPVVDYYRPNAGYMVMDDVQPLIVDYVLL